MWVCLTRLFTISEISIFRKNLAGSYFQLKFPLPTELSAVFRIVVMRSHCRRHGNWGKYFDEAQYDWPALYPQWEAFRRVREALDPQHRFANAFTTALFDH